MKQNIDKECICCKRFYSGSCKGVENRGRDRIVLENSCSGHVFVDNESDCNGDVQLYNEIKVLEKEIGIDW
jgi:hypothetical protein